MTFEQWWDEHWAEFFPTGDHRERILFAYDKERLGSEVKQVAAACWNAAIDEAARWLSAPQRMTDDVRLMANAIRVTPINAKMQKFSQ